MYNLIYKRISKSYFLLMVVWLLFACGTIRAQEATTTDISGPSYMVVDQYGRPVSGVEISIKKSDLKKNSDEDGIFNFDNIEGATLILSHPDYLVKEIKIPKNVKNKKVFRISLDNKKLKNPDTIDIPYRGSIDKDSYLGAASTVYSDELESTLSPNILSAMTARVPGLNIFQKNGFRKPMMDEISSNYPVGRMADITKGNYNDNNGQYTYTLRGATTPVVIVDGFEVEMLNLDVESIESISLQKDALSSMFLGGSSSRGVMYVTTKKPVAESFKLSFTGRYGLQEPIKTPKALSPATYANLLNEALINDGKSPIYSAYAVDMFRTGGSPYAYPTVDWYDEVLKDNAAVQSYNLNATGGGRTAQYFVNLGYLSEDGIVKNAKESYDTSPKYERYLITSKVNVNVMPGLKMSATVVGRIEDERTSGVGTNDILFEAYRLPSIAYPVTNPNGTYGGSKSSYDEKNLKSNVMSSGYKLAKNREGWGNVKLEHDMSWITEGLSARLLGSVSSHSRSAIDRSKQEAIYYYIPGVGSYEQIKAYTPQKNNFLGVYNQQQMYGQFGFDYSRTFANYHTFGGTLSIDYKDIMDNYKLPNDKANIYFEAKYDYKKRYFAQAAINRSYHNAYAPGRRWGTFYAFGLGWDITKEDFMSDVDWVNKLKLRGTYGETGNTLGADKYFIWRQSYKGDMTGYPEGDDYTSRPGVGEADDKLIDSRVSWERAHKLNIGLDANLFNNRLWITADVYRDNYFDLLMQRGKSIEIAGLKYPDENIGKRLYQGIDLSVTYQDNIQDFNYFITANWSVVKSEVKFMDEQNVPWDYMRQTGNAVGATMGYIVDGIFQSQEEINDPKTAVRYGKTPIPGDLKYRDLNGDGVINDFDKTIIANDRPLGTLGLNLGFEYKGVEISALFQAVYNRDINLNDAGRNEFTAGFWAERNGYNQAYEHIMNRWTPETASTAMFPRLTTSSDYSYETSDFWFRSGNFIRLKNLQVAYTLPTSFSRNYLGGAKVKVFITGQNLWTQAGCSLVDPEIVKFSDYPTMRGFNTGVNIKF